MHFTGEIFFDFDTGDVWRVYMILTRASQGRGVTVAVEWRPFLIEDVGWDGAVPTRVRGLAACEAVRAAHPAEYDRFARALLTMAYQEKDDPGSTKTLAVAARVAGLDGDDVTALTDGSGLGLLREASELARERGVTAVPTIARQGPPLYVKTTAATGYGDSVSRLELINRMLDDDGIWTLAKPGG